MVFAHRGGQATNGGHAWAFWSAWRGSPNLLVRAARATAWALDDSPEKVGCSIEIAVKGV
jgi:hypothetical protein